MWFNHSDVALAWASPYFSLIILFLSTTADLTPLKAHAHDSIVDIDIPTLPAAEYDGLDDVIISSQSLDRRGSSQSCFTNADIPSDSSVLGKDCTPIIPGVDKCLKKVYEKGAVPERTPLFYTKWDYKKLGVGGQEACKTWARCELRIPPIQSVTFADVVPRSWQVTKTSGILQPFKNEGITQESKLDAIADPFGKHISQAFAEACRNEVYLCIPQDKATDNVWDRDSAWGGWEFPALTRTNTVQRIYRVDSLNPNTKAGKKTLIWDRSMDPPDTFKPRGSRKSLLPEDMKKKYIPRNWERYDDNNDE